MNVEEVREYCLSLPGTEEAMPYGEDWVVFRIGGKIYLHIWLKAPIPTIAVKLLPERGEELREEYNAFSPAYHLCKKHWNDIFIEGTFPNNMLFTKSYDSFIHSSIMLFGKVPSIKMSFQCFLHR